MWLPDGLHWNLPQLFVEMLDGLGHAAAYAGTLDGIGVDAWGVDYGLLDGSGGLLGLPFHYRDDGHDERAKSLLRALSLAVEARSEQPNRYETESAASSRRRKRWTFPVSVRGRVSTNRTTCGYS